MTPASTLPEDAPHWARPRLERQIDMLGQLAEAGLEMALDVRDQTRALKQDGAVVEPAVLEGLSRAYARMARATRLSLMLQERLIKDLIAFDKKGTHDALWDQRAQTRHVQDTVEAIMDRVITRQHDDAQEIERLAYETAERLDREDLYGPLLSHPVSELVAMICEDLGLDPDWSRLATEAWAMEEAAGDAVGWPLAGAVVNSSPIGGGGPTAQRLVEGEHPTSPSVRQSPSTAARSPSQPALGRAAQRRGPWGEDLPAQPRPERPRSSLGAGITLFTSAMTRGFAVICFTVALDAVGVGLVLPILPGLLRSLGHGGDVERHYGLLLSAYALMQFLCSPMLGALSDRFGRRAVLLISLAGGAVDYMVMAATPFLWLLYATRIVAGISGANMAVASAYIADITTPEDRGKRFGQMSAAFGVGFIAGPVLGGWMGEIHLRAPFVLASVLCAANLVMGYFFLPESSPMVLRRETPAWRWNALNPFLALHGAFKNPGLRPLLAVYAVLAVIGQVGASIWVIYGQDRYHWSTLVVGVSLAFFGLAHAGAQAFLPGPLIQRLGERWAAFVAMMVDAGAYVWVGAARNGWMVLASTQVFCVGGVAVPALQALMTREVDEDDQGQLQGNLAALNSLAGIIGPIGFTSLYAATKTRVPGSAWFLGASLYIVCIALLAVSRHPPKRSAPAG